MGMLQHSETNETRKLWENSEYSEPNENGEHSGSSELIETSKDGLSESSESSGKESLVKLVRLAKVATISNLVIQRPCCVSLLETQHEQKSVGTSRAPIGAKYTGEHKADKIMKICVAGAHAFKLCCRFLGKDDAAAAEAGC